MPLLSTFNGTKGIRGKSRIFGPIVTQNLFMHYDFSNPLCYSGAGSTIRDLCGTQNGTIFNASFGGSRLQKAFDFERDAANNYIQLGSTIPVGQSTSVLTMEAWIFVESVGTDIGAIISSQYDSLQNGASISTDGRSNVHGASGSETLHYQLGINNAWTTTGSFGNSEQGTGSAMGWMHVVATRESDGSKYIYRNGVQVSFEGTFAGSITWSGVYWQIGAEPNGGTVRRFFDGKIAIVRIYNKALTASEVRYNYEGQKSRFGHGEISSIVDIFDDNSCSAYYQFENNSNDTTSIYNGTASNVTFTGSSKRGSFAASFNGTSSNISIPTIKNSYPFSVSFWATHNTSWVPTSGMNELMNLNIAGQRVSLGLVNNAPWPTGPCIFYGGTSHWSGPGVNATGLTSNSIYHHLCFVVYGSNDNQHRIYVNGYPILLTNNGGNHGGTANWAIGSNGVGGEFWNGNIDEVRFFNRVLTPIEVNALYQGGRVKTFSYTGSDQSWIIPSGVSFINAYAWAGAGGGANAEGYSDSGGAGGYSQARLYVTAGNTLTIQVGQGGGQGSTVRPSRAYPNGGLNSLRGSYTSGSGGGRSAIFTGTGSISTDNVLLIAGAGGGASAHGGGGPAAGSNMSGGSGGGLIAGGPGGYNNANVERTQFAGTQSSGGLNINTGSNRPKGRDAGQFQGADAGDGQGWSTGFNAAGGGGDGWYGGGVIDDDHSGGGGGSGYVGAEGGWLEKTAFTSGKKSTNQPPHTSNPAYSSGVAVGNANATGGNGRVVITY